MWFLSVVVIYHTWWLQASRECYWGPRFFVVESIKVGKEEAGKITFNKVYDKLRVNQDKSKTSELLEMAQQKFHVWINQCELIVIISTSIQIIPAKVLTDSFVAVNIHIYHRFIFLPGSRILRQLVRQDRQHIFGTTRGLIMIPCRLWVTRWK